MAKYDIKIQKNYAKLLNKGDELHKNRNFEKAANIYLRVYKFFKKNKNEPIFVEILKKVTDCLFGLENYEEALKYLKEILEISKKIKNYSLMASTLSDIGLVYKEFYDINKAKPFFIQAHKIYKDLGDNLNIVTTFIQLAIVDSLQGFLEESIKKLTEARDIAIKFGFSKELGIIYDNLASIYLRFGKFEEFKENYLLLVDVTERNKDPQHLSIFLNNTMVWFSQLQMIDDEFELLSMNLEICETHNLIGSKITCLTNFSRYYSRKGNFAEAKDFLDQAYKLAEESNLTNEKIGVFNGFGLLYREKGEFNKALNYYSKSLNMSKRFQDIFMVIENYKIIAKINQNLDNFSEAYRNYTETLKGYYKISKSIKNLKMREKFKQNYEYIPELIDEINAILESKKIHVKISEQERLHGFSRELCHEIAIENELDKSECIEKVLRMKEIIDNNKGNTLENDARELCRRIYNIDIATTSKEWKIDYNQVAYLYDVGCLKDKSTQSLEIDIYGENNTKNMKYILLGECKAKNKPMSNKEIFCFVMKANLIGEGISKSFRNDSSKNHELNFQFIIISLGGFSIDDPEQIFNQNCNSLIKKFKIELFDLDRFIKCLKQNKINPKFYNDLKSIKGI